LLVDEWHINAGTSRAADPNTEGTQIAEIAGIPWFLRSLAIHVNIRPAVIRLFKNRTAPGANLSQSLALGTLEFEWMEILWSSGESTVRDVVQKLSRPLAYTTVMTTLDRLFKKGLLNRHKPDRAFVYSPQLSRQEWERHRAGSLVAGFLSGPHPSRELLLSCFLDAVGHPRRPVVVFPALD